MGKQIMNTATDEIITVKRVIKDGGAYCARCPHCKDLIGLEGDDLSEIRGEQYQHRACGGWLQVAHEARFVREL